MAYGLLLRETREESNYSSKLVAPLSRVRRELTCRMHYYYY